MLKKYTLLVAFAVYISAALNITTYTYKTVGDLKIELDVYTPSTAAPINGYPVVLALHPGGLLAGSKDGALTDQEFNEAVNRGWVVVPIDHRLLPGVFFDDIYEDVQDAYQWVHTELPKITPVNLDAIILFGRSAGGGLAVLGGYKFSPRPKAIIGFYSFCTNWTDPYAYKPETPVNPLIVAAANFYSKPVVTEFNPTKFPDPKDDLWNAAVDSGKIGWMVTTHDPNFPSDQIIAKLREYSATEHVDENYPPTYLAHGLADTVVPYSQSVQFANVLLRNNIPYILDLVPNVNHAFDNDTALFQQYVLPAFDFAQKYIESETTTKTPDVKFLEI